MKVKMFKQFVFGHGIIGKSEPKQWPSLNCFTDNKTANTFEEFPLLMNEKKNSLAFLLHYRLEKSNWDY